MRRRRRKPVAMTWSGPYCYTPPGVTLSFGDTAPAPSSSSFSLRNVLTSDSAKTVSAIALTYHGYRRTGSIVWALLYGLAGRVVPLAAVPISLAQGYGAKKACP